MTFVSEIETMTRPGRVQRCLAIEEKHGVVDIVFLMQFGEERVSNSACSGRFKRRMQQLVCILTTVLTRALLSFANQKLKRSGDSVQPVVLIIELDHSLVNRNDQILTVARFCEPSCEQLTAHARRQKYK
jgi:hypothetical protein